MTDDAMTPTDIRRRIDSINADDPEGAHGEEDSIWEDVLHAIVAGHPDPAAIAEAALKTMDLDFPRWYA